SAPCPETARTTVLRVGQPRQVLVQTAHEPTDVVQTSAPALDDRFCSHSLHLECLAALPPCHERRRSKEHRPTFDHLLLRPSTGALAINIQDEVIVITQYSVR